MPNIFFSLDHDGCSAILYETGKRKALEDNPDFHKPITFLMDAAKEVLSEILDTLAESHDSPPEVFCGSNRQSRWLDDITRSNVGSKDSAFDELRGFCREKGWVFNPFLLADKYLDKDDGYAIDNPAATSDRSISNNITSKFNEWDPAKIEILIEQIKRAGASKPGAIVDFYFIDDDQHNKIIPGIKSHFLTNPEDLPSNVKLHFIKYDWQILFDFINDHLDSPKIAYKEAAKALLVSKGAIQRAEVGGDVVARTQEIAFEIPELHIAAESLPEVPTALAATTKEEGSDVMEEFKASYAKLLGKQFNDSGLEPDQPNQFVI